MDKRIKRLVKEILTKDSCGCGCNTCHIKTEKTTVSLNESKSSPEILSEGLKYHISRNLPLNEQLYRAGSENYFNLWAEARSLYSRGILEINNPDDLELIRETNIGEFGILEDGTKVPLDFPMIENESKLLKEGTKYALNSYKTLLIESESKKKNPPLNKPKRGGSKKFYVYVRDPKTKKIKKVSFGGTTGLSVKINDPKARQAFAKRHNCAQKKDKTKPSYWSCRLPRFAKLLGLKGSFSGFW